MTSMRVAFLASLGLLGLAGPLPAQQAPSYTRHVKPFFTKYCTECHSGKFPKGGLDLTKYETLKQGGNTDIAFVAGKPDDSLIVKLVEKKQNPTMPPKKAKVHPAAADSRVLRDWIKAGAKDDTPRKGALPPSPAPDAAVALVALSEEVVAAAPAGPSFARDIKPFLNHYCVECHNSKTSKAGVNLESYQAIMKGDRKGRILLVASQPDNSRLLHTLVGKAKQMPPRKYRLQPTAAEIAKVRAWIQAGARDDSKARAVIHPEESHDPVSQAEDNGWLLTVTPRATRSRSLH
jgi:hypothetical protein